MLKCYINLRKICIYIYLFSYKRYFIIFRYLNNLCNLKKKNVTFFHFHNKFPNYINLNQ